MSTGAKALVYISMTPSGLRPVTKQDADAWLQAVPPPWREFIRFCRELRYGEIERLAVQDGVPVHAETVVTKVRFTSR